MYRVENCAIPATFVCIKTYCGVSVFLLVLIDFSHENKNVSGGMTIFVCVEGLYDVDSDNPCVHQMFG